MHKFLIIANPCSGRGKGRRLAEAVATQLTEGGAGATICHTTGPGDGERIAGAATIQADRPDCIVACGGDGTIQEVANALAQARTTSGNGCPALGLAPAGRCNDFARAFAIRPVVDSIVSTLLTGTRRAIDLGRVNGRYFCTIATCGVDAKISSFVDRMRMPLRGKPAYLYGAVRLLWRDQASRFRFDGDVGEIEKVLFVASVANTPFYGGAIPLVPHADPYDGLLDLCMIDGIGRRRIATLLPRVIAGGHSEQKEVSFARLRRITISTAEPHEIWADGERMGTTPAVFEVALAAVEVMHERSNVEERRSKEE